MYTMVEKNILRNHKKQKEKIEAFSNYICNLFDQVKSFYYNVGEFTLKSIDFKLLGKREVPCLYHITDSEIVLILDYSYTPFFSKSFDVLKFDYNTLKKILNEKGIEFFRQSDHPEYECTSSFRYKDYLIFKTNRIKDKSLKMTRS